MKAIIIGGGIAGLATAIGLKNKNIAVSNRIGGML